MKPNLRLLAFYLVPVVLLSSVDLTYEWFSPLTMEDGTTVKWYEFAGLRSGAIGIGNYDTGPAAGLTLAFHAPQFIPFPFYAAGGPEGGGVFIDLWFIGLVAWSVHALWCIRARRNAHATACRA